MEAHVGGKKSQILRKRKNGNKRSDYLCFSSWVDLSYARELWKGFLNGIQWFHLVLTWFHPTWMVKVTINENCYIDYCLQRGNWYFSPFNRSIFFTAQDLIRDCYYYYFWGLGCVLNEVRTSQTRNFGFISFDLP